ncbi:MAG: hypothetical protein AB7P37_17160 [Ramlibacter sp.]
MVMLKSGPQREGFDQMSSREITSLMHRLFRLDLGASEYVHLMVEDRLDQARVDELLIFVDRIHWTFSNGVMAFVYIKELLPYGRVRIADPRFRGRVIIEPLGVGAGCAH